MPKRLELVGQRFGRLRVESYLRSRTEQIKTRPGRTSVHAVWLCRCDCGNTCERESSVLTGSKRRRSTSACDECVSRLRSAKMKSWLTSGHQRGAVLRNLERQKSAFVHLMVMGVSETSCGRRSSPTLRTSTKGVEVTCRSCRQNVGLDPGPEEKLLRAIFEEDPVKKNPTLPATATVPEVSPSKERFTVYVAAEGHAFSRDGFASLEIATSAAPVLARAYRADGTKYWDVRNAEGLIVAHGCVQKWKEKKSKAAK